LPMDLSMSPALRQDLAAAHVEELRRRAARSHPTTHPGPPRGGARSGAKHRPSFEPSSARGLPRGLRAKAGWLLVDIGLHLARSRIGQLRGKGAVS
jgi:hypothetical protein